MNLLAHCPMSFEGFKRLVHRRPQCTQESDPQNLELREIQDLMTYYGHIHVALELSCPISLKPAGVCLSPGRECPGLPFFNPKEGLNRGLQT